MQDLPTVNVYPNLKHSVTICKAHIETVDYTLFKQAVFRVSLVDPTDRVVDIKIFVLSGDDFSKWNSDDKYVLDWIKLKLQDER